MKYLIAQQWANIKGNHAGYPHICSLLEKKYPEEYRYIECLPIEIKKRSNTLFGKLLKYYIDPWISKQKYKKKLFVYCKQMLQELKSGDDVFLLEYNMPITPQYSFAKHIKTHFKGVRVMAMTHLTPSLLNNFGMDEKKIIQWDAYVDKHITLGSSLSEYLKYVGIANEKISTGFHAVDMEYYKAKVIHTASIRTTVITIGALQRDYDMLCKIVKACPDVDWVICKGFKEVDSLFEGLDNVRLVGFVKENELRRLMESSDVSMSVLEDTIGSNVITTSMAMGLAMVVSDVGSIRDYCDENNAVFCQNKVESFVSAINSLNDKEKISKMKKASLEKVKQFSIERTHEWFSNL